MTPDSSLALSSGRRSRRRTKPKLSLIAFAVQQDWFALPTQEVYRVVPLGPLYGINPNTGVSLTRYQDRDIPVLELERRIFAAPATRPRLPPNSISATPGQRYLLLLAAAEPIGLALDTPPHLYRVDETAFAPLPSTYLTEGSLRCVSALVSPDTDRPSLFLLNLGQLLQTHAPSALPNSSLFYSSRQNH